MNGGTRTPPTLGTPLTERELQILQRVALGDTNPQVGKALHLSHNTVKTHLGRLTGKLGARTRVDAVRIAIEQGLLPGYRNTPEGDRPCDSTLDDGEQVCNRKGTHAVHRSVDGKSWPDNLSDQHTTAPPPVTAAQTPGDAT